MAAVEATHPAVLERLIKVMQVVQQVRTHHLIIRAVAAAEQAALLVPQLILRRLVEVVERVSLHQSQVVVLPVQVVAAAVLKPGRQDLEPVVEVMEIQDLDLVLLERLILVAVEAQAIVLLALVDLV